MRTGSIRRGLQTAVLAAVSLCFLLLNARLVASRGPIELRAPATVVSNSYPAQRLGEPYLLFLRDVRRLVPPGASIAVIGPNAGGPLDPMDYLVALGQLPRNEIAWWRGALERSQNPPRFLAVYGRDHVDDRYRPYAVVVSGQLWELEK